MKRIKVLLPQVLISAAVNCISTWLGYTDPTRRWQCCFLVFLVFLLSLTSIHIGQMLKIPGTLDGGDTGMRSSCGDETPCPEMSNEYVSDAHNQITLSVLALR